MCRSLAEGGRRCASGHPAVRAAKRAASKALAGAVAEAGDDHPATAAYLAAKAWAEKTQQAVKDGDEDTAKLCAANAKAAAKASKALLTGKPAGDYPSPEEKELGHPRPTGAAELESSAGGLPAGHAWPEHTRAAVALADAAGAGAQDAAMIPRDDGGQGIAWSGENFNGAAAVYPGTEDEGGHPQVRLVLSDMDQSSYEALAASPWPYRTDGGSVIYDRLPADQARQVVEAARSGQPGKPWERHGLRAGGYRDTLPYEDAAKLEPESAAWSSELSESESEWVKRYTGTDYYRINKHLYEGRSLAEQHESDDVPMQHITDMLDSALAKAPRPEQPHRTFRGFKPPLEVRKANQVAEWARSNFQVGQVYRDDSYISVSHCPAVAAGFASTWWSDGGESGDADHGVVFEMTTSRGAAVASVSVFNNDERERLLPRGSTFRVVGVHEDAVIDGKKAVLVQMVDVHDIPRF